MAARPSLLRRVANGLGWGVLAAGALVALAVAGPLLIGDHPRTDFTGSMEPTISAGDVVIEEPISPLEAKVGDIVTFRDPEEESKELTHRVRSIKPDGSELAFVTKGDANNTREHWQIPVGGQLGRIVYVVPWVGHVAALTHTRLGWLVLLAIPLLLLALEELVRIWRPRGGAIDGAA